MSKEKHPIKTRAQMIDTLSKMLLVDKKQAKKFMETYESLLLLELSTSKEARFGNLGKFKISHRAERKGVNPKTGENVIIPEKNVPKFVFTKGVKEIISAGITVDDTVRLTNYEPENDKDEPEYVLETIETDK
ncbi:HU family DNA-binding protein [Ureaplasma canigenitalium]|uniref:HU family DNA-binding protein n=1 Tax=Ureaplasma canigenitalium TaxID=42092 RepID=UPI0004E1ED62|nr:HU family DNA-binding protein [Ureaplasma canigenitalium]